MAVDAGADLGISDPAELRLAVMEAAGGRGADLVIECESDARPYAQAQELMRRGGHLAAFGLTGPNETLSLDILKTILQENSVKGSVAGMGQDMHDSLTLLAHGRIQTYSFTGISYPLDDIQSGFEPISNRPQDLKAQIVMSRALNGTAEMNDGQAQVLLQWQVARAASALESIESMVRPASHGGRDGRT